jgi:hypothetical protein
MPASRKSAIELLPLHECEKCGAFFRSADAKASLCQRCWRLHQINALVRTTLNGERPHPKVFR